MEEKFIENGEYTELPGNEQTLRNFVHHLEKTGQISVGEEHHRIYDHVFDTPPGEQMLIYFGEVTLSKNVTSFLQPVRRTQAGQAVLAIGQKIKAITTVVTSIFPTT